MYSSVMSSVPAIRRNESSSPAALRHAPRDVNDPPPTTTPAGTPSRHHLSSTFDQLKAEYDAAIRHAHVAEQAKLDMERRVQAQLAEMAHMQQILTALEATHRRICREYDQEVARLRRDVEARNDLTTAAPATEQPSMMPSSTKRLRTTARSGDSVSTPARGDSSAAVHVVIGVAPQVAASSGSAQTTNVTSSEKPKSVPRAQSSLVELARTTRIKAPQGDLHEQPASSSPPNLSPQHVHTSKPNGQHQAGPRTAVARAAEADDNNRPPARASSTIMPRQESAKPPSSSPPVAPRDGATVPAKQFSASPDKPPSSKSTVSAVLSWKCVYPSKSALPSMAPGKEHERPATELHHAMDLQSAVCTVRFSRDGAMVAAGCLKSAQVFDVKTGERTFVVSHPNTETDATDKPATASTAEQEDDGHVRAICFAPDNTKLIVGMPHNTIRTWDLASQAEGPVVMTGHEGGIYALDCANDIIVSGSGDRSVRLWDARSGQCKKILGRINASSGDNNGNGPLDGVTSVALSPDGGRLLASGSLDKVVRVYDTETGQLLSRFEGHSDSVYSVAFSPDGRQLASGSFDRTIMLWNVGGGAQASHTRPRMVFQGHRELVLSVAYTPDGRYLVSGSKDRTVRFWDPRSSRSELTLTGHRNSVIGVAASPVSPYFATASGDGVAALWKYRCESL